MLGLRIAAHQRSHSGGLAGSGPPSSGPPSTAAGIAMCDTSASTSYSSDTSSGTGSGSCRSYRSRSERVTSLRRARVCSMRRPSASLGTMALIAALLTAQLISSASAQVHNYSQALELPFMCVPAGAEPIKRARPLHKPREEPPCSSGASFMSVTPSRALSVRPQVPGNPAIRCAALLEPLHAEPARRMERRLAYIRRTGPLRLWDRPLRRMVRCRR